MADHPVKVPPALFTGWLSEAMLEHDTKPGTVASLVADKAAQWGADQELEACCEWVAGTFLHGTREANQLRTARRPKPPSLVERATAALQGIASGANNIRGQDQSIATLTAALNRLAELEAQQ